MQIFKLLETPPVSLRDSCSIYQILSGIFGSQCSPVRKIFDLDRTRGLFTHSSHKLIANEYSSSLLTSSNKSPTPVSSTPLFIFASLFALLCFLFTLVYPFLYFPFFTVEPLQLENLCNAIFFTLFCPFTLTNRDVVIHIIRLPLQLEFRVRVDLYYHFYLYNNFFINYV